MADVGVNSGQANRLRREVRDLDRAGLRVDRDLAGVRELADAGAGAVDPDLEQPEFRLIRFEIARRLAEAQVLIRDDDDPPASRRVDLLRELQVPHAAQAGARAEAVRAGQLYDAVAAEHFAEADEQCGRVVRAQLAHERLAFRVSRPAFDDDIDAAADDSAVARPADRGRDELLREGPGRLVRRVRARAPRQADDGRDERRHDRSKARKLHGFTFLNSRRTGPSRSCARGRRRRYSRSRTCRSRSA
jgi:hypothetical protein